VDPKPKAKEEPTHKVQDTTMLLTRRLSLCQDHERPMAGEKWSAWHVEMVVKLI